MIQFLYILLCSIVILLCGFVCINLTGYYEIDIETKLIRSVFFLAAVGFAILIGTII
jgi:hypothetical protein